MCPRETFRHDLESVSVESDGAVESDGDMIRCPDSNDITTCRMIEGILVVEDEHAGEPAD